MLHRNLLIPILLLFVPILVWGQGDRLTGKVISSMPMDANSVAENAFDDNTNTSFVASEASMAYVGLDLGKSHVITSVSICASHEAQSDSTLLLGLFEGANRPDFMDALPLRCITDLVDKGSTATFPVDVTRGFRYVRYVGPANRHCAVSELAFMGYDGEGYDSIYYQVTNLPTFSIHTTNCEMPLKKKVDIESSMTLIYENGTQVQEYPILVRPRGNFSFNMENKPYRIKFNDDKKHHIMTDSETDKSPAKKKKWCLINNTTDKTLMRTLIASEVSRKVGMSYVPYARSCDVFLNGEYRGNYLIMDYLDVNKNRIDIDEMEATDVEGEELTGGYFLECDGYAGKDKVEKFFYTTRKVGFTLHSPEEEVLNPSQFNYIKTHLQKFEDRLFAENYTDSVEGYRSMFDLSSFLDYFLTSEFNGNYDILWQWFFLKQRGDDHFYIGPIWDAELSMNNYSPLFDQNSSQYWTYVKNTSAPSISYVDQILSDAYAFSEMEKKWDALRTDAVFSPESMNAIVDSCTALLSQSQRLHFLRWPYMNMNLNKNKIWGSWEAEVQNVRDYVVNRIGWMDKKLHYKYLATANGVYQISTPKELVFFSHIVNSGNNNVKAILTSDIDMSNYSDAYTPIGTETMPFVGSFDGQYHRIANLKLGNKQDAGLFGTLGDNARVNNVYLDETCVLNGQKTAGLIAHVAGQNVEIVGCGNGGEVSALDGYAAGIVGLDSSGSLKLVQCFNTGKIISAQYVADIAYSTDVACEVKNCYNIGEIADASSHSIRANAASLTDANSGALCYEMNEQSGTVLYYQNLDNGDPTDAFPLPYPSHGVVYKDNNVYTNSMGEVPAYRYFQLYVQSNKGDQYLQFSEFDLLNEKEEEVQNLEVYAGVGDKNSKQSWPLIADNNTETKYCQKFTAPVYFLFDAKVPTSISGYRIYTANDTKSVPARNMKDWVLLGSHTYSDNPTDTCWNVIHEHFNDNNLKAENKMPSDFFLSKKLVDMQFADNNLLLYSGDRIDAHLVISPRSMADTKLVFTSSDESVVRVSQNGQIEAVGNGQAEVIATAIDCNSKQAVLSVRVSGADDPGYRFYMFKVDDINYNVMKVNNLQFSEFALLLSDSEEFSGLKSSYGEYGCYNNQEYFNATDGNLNTKVCLPFTGNASFYYAMPTRVPAIGYRITTANDTKMYASTPKSWSLWGSNSYSIRNFDSCWTLLDYHLNDDVFVGADNFKAYDFFFDDLDVIKPVHYNNPATSDYDLSGRRVANKKKGVYLHHNEKGEMRKVLY